MELVREPSLPKIMILGAACGSCCVAQFPSREAGVCRYEKNWTRVVYIGLGGEFNGKACARTIPNK